MADTSPRCTAWLATADATTAALLAGAERTKILKACASSDRGAGLVGGGFARRRAALALAAPSGTAQHRTQ